MGSNRIFTGFSITATTSTYTFDTSALLSNTSLSLSVSPSSTISTQTPVTLTAQLTSTAATAPSGVIQFMEGHTPLGAASLIGNSATLVVPSLIEGHHPLKAVYAGDANNSKAYSNVVFETIVENRRTPSLALTCLPGIVLSGASSSCTVQMPTGSIYGFTPTGTIAFALDGISNIWATVALDSSGAISTVTPVLTATGDHTVIAVYSGDANYRSTINSASFDVVTTTDPTEVYSFAIPDGGYAPDGNLLSYTDSVMGVWGLRLRSLSRNASEDVVRAQC